MMQVLLIHAGPTPWDIDDRITGAENLPLTPEAIPPIQAVLGEHHLFIPDAVYCPRGNDACQEVAKMVAEQTGQRIRFEDAFSEMKLGLWEGLTRDQVRHRYPSVTQQWQDHPQQVLPPDGESMVTVVDRVYPVLVKMERKYRDKKVIVVLRPLIMAIVAGILRGRTMRDFAADLTTRRSHDLIEVAGLPQREAIG